MVITDHIITALIFLFSGIFVSPIIFCLFPVGLSIDNSSKTLTIRTAFVLLLKDSKKEASWGEFT